MALIGLNMLLLILSWSSVKSNLQDDCVSERCCETRIGVENKLCSSMALQECVSNDKYCIWNCDKSGDDTIYIGARGQGKFIGFSNGKGILRNYTYDKEDEQPQSDPILKMNATEYVKYTSFRIFGKCGDIYEYKLPVSVAQQRLNKILSGLYTTDVNVDYEYGKKINVDDSRVESILDGDTKQRRRLTIFPPDGRNKSTSKNIYPYRTNGKLRSNSGGCSATLISKRVILTAAHCVYDTENNDWISNKRFYPDSTSSSDIVSSNEYIGYGMVWNNWIDVTCCKDNLCCSSAFDWDIALIRLDVAIGSTKGWMSYGYNNGLSSPQSFNTYGYPGDKPYGERWWQYCKYNKVNTNTFNSNECDVIGGQSGSSIYKYWPSSNKRIIYGVVVSANSVQNTYCRITSTKFWDMCDFIDDAESSIC